MYLGPFYINTKELFLLLALVIIGLAWKMEWSIWWFDKKLLLIVVGLVLGTKTLLPAIQNEAFFILGIVAVFLTLYLSAFQITIFYFISFALLRWAKIF